MIDGVNKGLGVNGVNSNNTNNPKENKTVSKTIVGATLVGLAAFASVGIYLATKGKSKCNIKPQDLKENNPVNKFENIINEFKTKHDQYADIEPTITTLKNGKTKIEFNSQNGENFTKQILVCDKNDKFEKLISINKTGNVKDCNVFKDIDKKNYIKSTIINKHTTNKNGTNVEISNIIVNRRENKQTWRQDITTKKSDNIAYVNKSHEYIIGGDRRGQGVISVASLKNGKPDIVHQTHFDINGEAIKEVYFKPAEKPLYTPCEDTPFGEVLKSEFMNVWKAK